MSGDGVLWSGLTTSSTTQWPCPPMGASPTGVTLWHRLPPVGSGMMAGLCLVPCDLCCHSGLGGPSPHASCQDACLCLVPCDLCCHLGLGGPGSLVLPSLLLFLVSVRVCSFLFLLAVSSISCILTSARLGSCLSCCVVGRALVRAGWPVRSFALVRAGGLSRLPLVRLGLLGSRPELPW